MRRYDVNLSEKNEQEYRKLVVAAHTLLGAAGQFTIDELSRINDGLTERISVNEMLGMAVRALNDAAKEAQDIADEEERKNG